MECYAVLARKQVDELLWNGLYERARDAYSEVCLCSDIVDCLSGAGLYTVNIALLLT